MRKTILLFGLCALICVMTIGCTDASQARFGTYAEGFQVTLYAENGSVIKEWTAKGKVEMRRSGFHFVDKNTRKYVMVTGTVAVESVTPR